MGLCDIALVSARCPSCQHLVDWRLQYKYGFCGLHEYRPGDDICWLDPPGRDAPRSDFGDNTVGHVLVESIAENGCPRCASEFCPSLVFVDNRLHGIASTPPERVEPSKSWLRIWSRRVAGGRNEDRLAISCRGRRWTIAVTDGAGGISGGARAASDAAEDLAAGGADAELDSESWCDQLRRLDLELEADRVAGETTAVVVQINDSGIRGASVGDSQALVVGADSVIALTERQTRKPLLGSGAAHPVGFSAPFDDGRLLMGTDGLFNYVDERRLANAVRASSVEDAVRALIELVRLSDGSFHDDIALVVATREPR